MMNETTFIMLDTSDHTAWQEVAGLLTQMYGEMDSMGLMLPLAGDGHIKWLSAARNTAGKFSVVALAQVAGKAIGFAQGMIKFLPDYLGGHMVGSVTHVFVDGVHRGTGVGKGLVKMLEDWFRDKKVHSVELQVISGNTAAKEFWKELGYTEELTQYRKTWTNA